MRKGVDVFDRDAARGGYTYTSGKKLSSRMATRRTIDTLLETGCFDGRRVLDMACGDGYYTTIFWDQGKPRSITAVDAAPRAVELARINSGGRPISFLVADVHRLPWPDDSFDLALVQSILHHDDRPADIMREAFRLAPEVLLHEPNGYNPGLKAIEKVSRYHREHGEKSYPPRLIKRWIREAGGVVISERFAGFVPMFCPDWLARIMKTAEGVVERLPIINRLACAVYLLVAVRSENTPEGK